MGKITYRRFGDNAAPRVIRGGDKTMLDKDKASVIAQQNDAVRKAIVTGLTNPKGAIFAEWGVEWESQPLIARLVVTTGIVAEYTLDGLLSVLQQVADFEAFTEDNDPYGEHDWAAMDVVVDLEGGAEGRPDQLARQLLRQKSGVWVQ